MIRPAGELQFLGGHPALDFINTAEGRGEPDAGDALGSAEDLRTWGRRQGIISSFAPAGGSNRQELRRALEAREVLYRLLSARAHGKTPAEADLRELSGLTAASHRAGVLRAHPDGGVKWSWSPDELASVRHFVVDAATELLSEAPGGRLKQCPGEHCGWLFLDTTKRGNRRWCSMEECGQEAKVARRRMRRATADYRSGGDPGS